MEEHAQMQRLVQEEELHTLFEYMQDRCKTNTGGTLKSVTNKTRNKKMGWLTDNNHHSTHENLKLELSRFRLGLDS